MTKVKICGITELDDARRAASLGAWALGLIFWPGSPRRCEPEAAEQIGAALRRQAELTGVFVNATLDEVAQAADRFRLTLLQLHGDEGPAYCREAARRTGCRVMKAARVRNASSIRALEPFHTDYHLLDAHVPEVPGGTGHTFEWELARAHRGRPAAALGRAHAGERGGGHRDRAAVRGGRGGGHRGRAGSQGRAQARGVLPRGGRRRGGARARMSQERGGLGAEREFGPYGGRFVPETLVPALDELEAAWLEARADPGFGAELEMLLADYAGRPTPLYLAPRLSEAAGSTVYLKREDLLHTGAHKINNALGQALLARRMGKRRVIAETGAGQHGVATATACALLGLDCVVYMGTEDMRRQRPNVERMGLLGAEVRAVDAGARTLKEAVSAAIRDWVANVADTHYVIGSAVGPAPYPALVRDLQRVIGDELRDQVQTAEGRLPDRVIACVGGGSNAIGAFVPLVLDEGVELIGVEAAGEGLDGGRHSAPLTTGARGILHGALSAVLQDEQGQVLEAHSVSAGLDYPGSGPEHAWLRDEGRVRYVAVPDEDALAAFRRLAELEGIIPALEPAHALAWLLANPSKGLDVLVLSGRGDKDLAEVLSR